MSSGDPDTAVVGLDSRLTLHALVIRDSDDDPEVAVVGRISLGEFVEVPGVAADAIRLMGNGLAMSAVEARVEAEHDVRLDAVELAEAMVGLGFVRTVDGRSVPDPAAELRGSHLPGLRHRHVRWLFSWPVGLLWLGVLVMAVVTWWRRPDLLIAPSDFYWTNYVGLAVLVNTALFSVSVSVHELMHLAAARAYDTPARIGFATRLHHLVAQTDVTAAWALPRRQRYRVYLAGILWDSFVIGVSTLLIAHAGLPDVVDRLLAALSLVVALSLAVQVQIYMRTDLYYVLMEWLRCGNLFQDGLAYAGHLLRRAIRRPTADPTTDLPGRERRSVRIYAAAMVIGSTISLAVFATFGLPILFEGVQRALSGLFGGFQSGNLARAIDSALIIIVEGAIQVLFLRTFYRQHRTRSRLTY